MKNSSLHLTCSLASQICWMKKTYCSFSNPRVRVPCLRLFTANFLISRQQGMTSEEKLSSFHTVSLASLTRECVERKEQILHLLSLLSTPMRERARAILSIAILSFHPFSEPNRSLRTVRARQCSPLRRVSPTISTLFEWMTVIQGVISWLLFTFCSICYWSMHFREISQYLYQFRADPPFIGGVSVPDRLYGGLALSQVTDRDPYHCAFSWFFQCIITKRNNLECRLFFWGSQLVPLAESRP